MSSLVPLGTRLLGEGQPCVVAAHVGHGHGGRAADALQLIEASFKAGADAVVLSLFRAAQLLVRRHPLRREMEALELSDGDWRQVLEAARGSGLAVIAEVHDLPSLELACAGAVDAVQSHPDDLDNPELLRALARSGRPLLLATGGAAEPVLRAAAAAAGTCAALLIGPAQAPSPAEELRLGDLALLREQLRLPVGLLDPTDGGSAFALLVPALAAAQGAALVEKRLMLDRSRKGPDAAAALAPEQFYRCVELLRQAELARGEGAAHAAAPRPHGRSIVAASLIGRGEVITLERLAFKRTAERPERGLRPAEAQRVIGRRAARPIQADETIREEMLE